ncbi:MAG: AMP-binding protein [Pseudomonadota bacterium]|nr:AMP-binding protein [Pseudomonadota bacterium]
MLDETPAWARWYAEGVDPDFTPEATTANRQFDAFTTEFADRAALDYNDHVLTYADLRTECARLANALRARGIGPGDVVALYLPNTLFHPLFFFATLLTGATVTHLSPLDAVRELEHKVRDSGAKLVISLTMAPFGARAVELLNTGALSEAILCDDALYGGPGGALPDDPRVTGYAALVAGAETAFRAHPAQPGDRALLQYTGGTTGLPKAAVLTHANLAAAVQIYEYAWLNDPARLEGSASLVVSPFFHIMGLTSILMTRLKCGTAIVLHQRFDVNRVVDDIERKKVASTGGVPTMWIAIANMPGIETRDLSSLRSIGSGGAPMPVEIVRRIRDLTGLDMRGGWGMTETGAAGTSIPASHAWEKRASIGIPLPGVKLEIVDVDDPTRVLPMGETGEMRIKSPAVMGEYHANPEETARSFVDGWFLTGDIGHFDEDGFLYLVDRKKDLILSGGYNVYPQAIEQAIHAHPDVAEVMVIGVPDAYRGESARAYVVLKPGAEAFDLAALRAFLDDRLGRHEMPQGLEFTASLPRTPVGKYSRKMLRDQVLKALDGV